MTLKEQRQKYDQSAQKQRNFDNVYNEANALYKLGKYPEAARKNMEAFGLAKSPEQKSMSAYNLGNSFYQSKITPKPSTHTNKPSAITPLTLTPKQTSPKPSPCNNNKINKTKIKTNKSRGAG
jgi:DNA-binding SARP family transcriptional activator